MFTAGATITCINWASFPVSCGYDASRELLQILLIKENGEANGDEGRMCQKKIDDILVLKIAKLIESTSFICFEKKFNFVGLCYSLHYLFIEIILSKFLQRDMYLYVVINNLSSASSASLRVYFVVNFSVILQLTGQQFVLFNEQFVGHYSRVLMSIIAACSQ